MSCSMPTGGRRKSRKNTFKSSSTTRKRRVKGGSKKVVKHTDGKYYVVDPDYPKYVNPFNTEKEANARLEQIAAEQLTEEDTYSKGIPGDTPSPADRERVNEPYGVRAKLATVKLQKDSIPSWIERFSSMSTSNYVPSTLQPKAAKYPTYERNGGRRITRKAHWRYIRGMKIRVPAKKVKDMGARGKWRVKHGPGIGELEAGKLHGYATNETKRTRHMILKKDVKRDGAQKTMKRLNAIAVYMKRTAPSKSKTAKADRNWVKKNFTKK